MKFFHRADQDDLCETGFTSISGIVGGRIILNEPYYSGDEAIITSRREGGKYRWIGLRLLIEVPTPFRRMFEMDYGRYKEVRGVNWWVCLDLCRFGLSRFAYGSRARAG
jgi:hypothetical protein